MQQLFFIGLGGASGALMRFWLSQFVYFVFGRGFPYGTLVVNVLGSLCMGVLLEIALERSMLHENWRIALVIGFLGSFTTFSTFSADTLLLLHQGIYFRAGLNIVLSVSLCLAATALGFYLTRNLLD